MQTIFSLSEVYEIVERRKFELQFMQVGMDADLIELDNMLSKHAIDFPENTEVSLPFGIYNDDEKLDMYLFVLETLGYLKDVLKMKERSDPDGISKTQITIGQIEKRMRQFERHVKTSQKRHSVILDIIEMIDAPDFQNLPKKNSIRFTFLST